MQASYNWTTITITLIKKANLVHTLLVYICRHIHPLTHICIWMHKELYSKLSKKKRNLYYAWCRKKSVYQRVINVLGRVLITRILQLRNSPEKDLRVEVDGNSKAWPSFRDCIKLKQFWGFRWFWWVLRDLGGIKRFFRVLKSWVRRPQAVQSTREKVGNCFNQAVYIQTFIFNLWVKLESCFLGRCGKISDVVKCFGAQMKSLLWIFSLSLPTSKIRKRWLLCNFCREGGFYWNIK